MVGCSSEFALICAGIKSVSDRWGVKSGLKAEVDVGEYIHKLTTKWQKNLRRPSMHLGKGATRNIPSSQPINDGSSFWIIWNNFTTKSGGFWPLRIKLSWLSVTIAPLIHLPGGFTLRSKYGSNGIQSNQPSPCTWMLFVDPSARSAGVLSWWISCRRKF